MQAEYNLHRFIVSKVSRELIAIYWGVDVIDWHPRDDDIESDDADNDDDRDCRPNAIK